MKHFFYTALKNEVNLVKKLDIYRPYDTKLKVRGLKFKRASVSELKTELGAWGAHEKFSVEKASRLA